MTQLVLGSLAVAWIVVLAPDVARLVKPRGLRASSVEASSVERFRQQLDSLGRSAPAAPRTSRSSRHNARQRRARLPSRQPGSSSLMPATPGQAATRRRVIGTLLTLCTLVAIAGSLATRSLWVIAASALLLAVSALYVAAILQRRRARPSAQVHYLPLRDIANASTVTMIRRAANE